MIYIRKTKSGNTIQTKTTYTPGPWELGHRLAPDHDGDRVIYGPGKLPRFICAMDGGPNDDSEILANARLIAAAPELLDAAKGLVWAWNHPLGTKGTDAYAAALENAIAKAEGRI